MENFHTPASLSTAAAKNNKCNSQNRNVVNVFFAKYFIAHGVYLYETTWTKSKNNARFYRWVYKGNGHSPTLQSALWAINPYQQ